MSSPYLVVRASLGCTRRSLMPLASIDLDYGRVFDYDALFQRVYDSEARRSIDGGLRRGGPHGDYPRLVQKEFGPADGGLERQSVIGREGVPERDGERAIHAGEIAEPGEDPGATQVARAQVIGGLAGPFAARYGIDARFFPGDPVGRVGMRQPGNDRSQNGQRSEEPTSE